MKIFDLPKQEDVEEFSIGGMDVKLIELTPENQKHAIEAIAQIYENEPCRICGEMIGDTYNAVFAGYSADSKSRCAHKSCWNSGIPKSAWAYPD